MEPLTGTPATVTDSSASADAGAGPRYLSLRSALRAAALFVAYLIAAEAGFALSVSPSYPTVWPAAGLALAALLLSELDDWPLMLAAITLSALTSDVIHGRAFFFAAGMALVTFFEIGFGAVSVRRFAGPRPGLTTVRQVLMFVLFGVVLTPMVGATLGVVVEAAFGLVFPLWASWAGWFLADVAGIVIFGAPLLVIGVWWSGFRALSAEERRGEMKPLLLSVAITAPFAVLCWFIFTVQGGLSSFKFLLFPGFLAVGIIGGPVAGAVFLLAVGTVSLAGVSAQLPHVDTFTTAQGLTLMQAEGFFVVAGVTSLAFAAAIYENRHLATEALDYAEVLQLGTDQLRQTVQQTVAVMGRMVETRDPYTSGHEEGVARLSAQIARRLGMSDEDVEGVEMAGLVHDVGKLAVPAELLTKPGRLTAAEFSLIQVHSEKGYEILQPIDFHWPIAETVLQHHERLDGSGYPQGLVGEQITLPARILAIADVVDAMASHRPYRPALGIEAAIAEIRDNPHLFDSRVAAACVEIYEQGLIDL